MFPTLIKNNNVKKIILGSFSGALLEWYDFYTFGISAGIILGPLFFPQDNKTIGLIAAFATFGIGFFARPIGGIFFGHFGDKLGRKVSLIWTISIVGISTFLVGCIPTYNSIGVYAPVILVILRLIQGFGLGGEYGGAALMTIESVPKGARGFYGSIPQIASSAGIILATLVYTACNYFLTEKEFLSWGWRIPFLLSIIMLYIGLFIRTHTEETIEFREQISEKKSKKIPIVELFKVHYHNTILALGARLAETVSFNIINAFSISYISVQLLLNRNIPLTGMMISSFIGIIMCPIIGYLSDKYGQKIFYMMGSLFCAVFIYPFFMILDSQNSFLIWIAYIAIYNLGTIMMFSIQPTMFAKMFSVDVRYTGLSFVYQFSSIVGGLTPLVCTLLLSFDHGFPWYVCGFMVLISLCTFVCVSLIRENENNFSVSGSAKYQDSYFHHVKGDSIK